MDRIQTIHDRAAQWAELVQETMGVLPIGSRESLEQLLRDVVLDAAAVCDRRAAVCDQMGGIEATKCAEAIRFVMLCRPGELVCISCNGTGCTECCGRGVREVGQP